LAGGFSLSGTDGGELATATSPRPNPGTAPPGKATSSQAPVSAKIFLIFGIPCV
jgi:hypothetical protein